MEDEIAELEGLLGEIEEMGIPVIVEGFRDRDALRKLGITNIFVLWGKPVYKVAEEVAETSREAVLLTDLDDEGKKLFGRLNTDLQALGVRVNKRLRNFLFKNTKLRQIEGMAHYIRRHNH